MYVNKEWFMIEYLGFGDRIMIDVLNWFYVVNAKKYW